MIDTKSQRVAYGKTLVELGKENPDIVVLEADLGKSTMGCLFEAEFPERFFEIGIAEANMAGIAGGLALTGKIPFIASFAVFSTGRCFDQIRNAMCVPKLNVKICGSSAGLSDYGDGSTHQSIEDMALMRSLPNMQVFVPADAVQTEQIVRYMAANQGPMYIRVCRNDLPIFTDPQEPFVPGKVYTLKEGKDAAIFACGTMVSKAMEAAELLEKEGISARVVNVPTIKPLDKESVRAICKGVKGVVTAEEHTIYGGLGSTIAETIVGVMEKKINMVGIKDSFGTSAQNYDILLQKYGLTAEAVANAVREVLK